MEAGMRKNPLPFRKRREDREIPLPPKKKAA